MLVHQLGNSIIFASMELSNAVAHAHSNVESISMQLNRIVTSDEYGHDEHRLGPATEQVKNALEYLDRDLREIVKWLREVLAWLDAHPAYAVERTDVNLYILGERFEEHGLLSSNVWDEVRLILRQGGYREVMLRLVEKVGELQALSRRFVKQAHLFLRHAKSGRYYQILNNKEDEQRLLSYTSDLATLLSAWNHFQQFFLASVLYSMELGECECVPSKPGVLTA